MHDIVTCINNSCACLLNRSIQTSDSPLQVKRKRLLIPLCVSLILGGIAIAMLKDKVLLRCSGLLLIIGSLPIMFQLLVLKGDATDRLLTFLTACGGLSIISSDLSTITSYSTRMWPNFVIIVDVLLVCEAPHRITISCLLVCCLYLSVMAAESSTRFGILDLEWEGYTQEERLDRVTCDGKLPCAVSLSTAVLTLGLQLLVFVTDFVCTRGFAMGLIVERNQIIASISTANEIATSLAKFDLVLAGSLLDEAEIPDKLRVAFENLLRNLKSYQPYLQQSCLVQGSSDGECDGLSLQSISRVSSELGASTSFTATIKKSFQSTKASLLVVNIRNSLQVLDHSLQGFESLITSLVSTVFATVTSSWGTPDLFLGDRMFANFGATRPQRNHVNACLDCCTVIANSSKRLLSPFQPLCNEPLSVNMAVAMGEVAAGDLGFDSMLRFSIIGSLSHSVAIIERAGAQLGIPIAASESFHKQIADTRESRLILQPVVYDGKTLLIFSITPINTIESKEWMYELHEGGTGRWDDFNSAAAEVLNGRRIPSQYSHILSRDGPVFDELRQITRTGVPEPIVFSKR
eukprot:TRINITY_DN2283_c2_g1_i1.p1 TRINITY_DN2283_c2_g1~~TRINITY_DN2283_c2_g1_i1.p1  ORF type:complete len:576 (+),score=82.24 TRINITY_DN2283_c2_g1_i1:69-1796(+)